MVAVLTDPEAAKAATLTGGGELAYFSFPIEKVEDAGDGEVIVYGKATDGSLDSDLQIVDPDWSRKAIQEWYDTGANLRVQHQSQRDPAGKGIDVDGHNVRARVVEPVAVKLVKAGVLQDFSIGIMNPDIRRGDPRFKHLDPMGKAVNGIITGRDDGLTKVGEISLVDRGSNFGTKFAMLKAAADGSAQWVGELTAPDDVLAKVTTPRTYKTVSVDLPKSMRIKVSPTQLAKMNTMAKRVAMESVLVPEPGPAKVADPLADPAGNDLEQGYLAAMKAVGDAEDAIVGKGHRTFTAEERHAHASSGTALPDGSYPMPDADAVRRAAILIRSKHGDWKAAAKLLASRVRALGIPNPLKNKVKGPQSHKAAEATPDAAKCMKCDDTGMADDAPCPDCKKGRKAAKAAAALDAAVTADLTVKKKKVMCGGCGARQNREHNNCSECGKPMAGAMPVEKNHEYTCLGCGKTLDKGEKFCPGCGKENPGYLPEADHQIPANKTSKDRVTKGKKKAKGKGKGKPFGGSQAKPFGAKDDDGDQDDAKKAAEVVKGKKGKKGKGRSPAEGVHAQHTDPLPEHREPDGPAVEAFEKTTSLEDGDAEMKTAMRHSRLGMDPQLAVLHDLTCPAFSPGDVSKSLPFASFAGIDADQWQVKTLDAAASGDMREAMRGYELASGLYRHAAALKDMDPQILYDVRTQDHEAFLAANKTFRDATPGPGSFPSPSHVTPGAFRRPYVSDGHAAPSPGHDGPRSFPVATDHPVATDFHRGHLTEGHAADSPANSTPRTEPVPAPADAGKPSRVYYQNVMRDNARQAMTAMHDHISRVFPDVCPMSPAMGDTQKPAPPVPDGVGGPVPHKAGKSAKASKKTRKAAKVKSRKQRKAKVVTKTAAAPAPAPETVPAPVPVIDEFTITKAVSEAVGAATKPLVRKMARQDRVLRKQRKLLDAVADQRDTTVAPFRGAAAIQKASPGLAAPATAAESAEQAQTALIQRLHHEWRNSSNPEIREAAYAELSAQMGLTPKTAIPTIPHPFTH